MPTSKSDQESNLETTSTEFVYPNRQTAQSILSSLEEVLRHYGMATLSDLKLISGRTPKSGDDDWGWLELGACSVKRGTSGKVAVYSLVLPRPKYIGDKKEFDARVKSLIEETSVMTISELRELAEHAQLMVRVRPEGKDKDVAFTFLKLVNGLFDSVENQKVDLNKAWVKG